jgi:hypothetical protein
MIANPAIAVLNPNNKTLIFNSGVLTRFMLNLFSLHCTNTTSKKDIAPIVNAKSRKYYQSFCGQVTL